MARSDKAKSAFDQALRLIRSRANEGITIEQVLESVNISQQALQRLFRQHLGRTPGEELSRMRLLRARELLCSTRLPIKVIALQIGFRNARDFSAFFRREAHMTPTAFRQANNVAKNSPQNENNNYTLLRTTESYNLLKDVQSTALNLADSSWLISI